MGIEYGERRSTFIDYGRPSLVLDFARRKSLIDSMSETNLITFTRSSTATYVGSDGYIKTAAADEARFDHDPVTGESLGLLIEEQRTNTSTNSSIGNTIINGSLASNTIVTNIVTPYGDLSSCRSIVHGTTIVNNYYRVGGSVNITAGQPYTVSCFVRNPNNHPFESITNGAIAGIHLYRFNTGQNNSVAFGSSNMRIERFPNEWTRYSATFTAQATSTVDGYFNVVLNYPPTYGWSYQLWGFQIEQGSFPTSYIPTSGSTVTRQPDNAQITGSNFSSWYNQSEGSFYTDMKLNPSFPVSGRASISFTLSDSSYNNRITLASSTGSNAFNADVTISGTNYRAVLGNYTSGSNSIKSSIGYKSTNTAGSLNGASPVTSSPSGSLPLLTRADIGKDHTNFNYLSGHIRRITYYPTRLTNTQLQALTQ